MKIEVKGGDFEPIPQVGDKLVLDGIGYSVHPCNCNCVSCQFPQEGWKECGPHFYVSGQPTATNGACALVFFSRKYGWHHGGTLIRDSAPFLDSKSSQPRDIPLCTCATPDLITNEALGKQFTVCRKCKKER